MKIETNQSKIFEEGLQHKAETGQSSVFNSKSGRENNSVLSKPITQGRYQGFFQENKRKRSLDNSKAFRVRLPQLIMEQYNIAAKEENSRGSIESLSQKQYQHSFTDSDEDKNNNVSKDHQELVQKNNQTQAGSSRAANCDNLIQTQPQRKGFKAGKYFQCKKEKLISRQPILIQQKTQLEINVPSEQPDVAHQSSMGIQTSDDDFEKLSSTIYTHFLNFPPQLHSISITRNADLNQVLHKTATQPYHKKSLNMEIKEDFACSTFQKNISQEELQTFREQISNGERAFKAPKSLYLNKFLNFESMLLTSQQVPPQSQQKSPNKYGSKYILSKRLSLERRKQLMTLYQLNDKEGEKDPTKNYQIKNLVEEQQQNSKSLMEQQSKVRELLTSNYYAQSFIYRSPTGGTAGVDSKLLKTFYLDELILKDPQFFRRMVAAKGDIELLREGVMKSIAPKNDVDLYNREVKIKNQRVAVPRTQHNNRQNQNSQEGSVKNEESQASYLTQSRFI